MVAAYTEPEEKCPITLEGIAAVLATVPALLAQAHDKPRDAALQDALGMLRRAYLITKGTTAPEGTPSAITHPPEDVARTEWHAAHAELDALGVAVNDGSAISDPQVLTLPERVQWLGQGVKARVEAEGFTEERKRIMRALSEQSSDPDSPLCAGMSLEEAVTALLKHSRRGPAVRSAALEDVKELLRREFPNLSPVAPILLAVDALKARPAAEVIPIRHEPGTGLYAQGADQARRVLSERMSIVLGKDFASPEDALTNLVRRIYPTVAQQLEVFARLNDTGAQVTPIASASAGQTQPAGQFGKAPLLEGIWMSTHHRDGKVEVVQRRMPDGAVQAAMFDPPVSAGVNDAVQRAFRADDHGNVPDEWPMLTTFSALMRGLLDCHRPKKGGPEGWRKDKPGDLLHRVRQETNDLGLLLTAKERPLPQEVQRAAADVANMAMMVADAYACQFAGELEQAKPAPQPSGNPGELPRTVIWTGEDENGRRPRLFADGSVESAWDTGNSEGKALRQLAALAAQHLPKTE